MRDFVKMKTDFVKMTLSTSPQVLDYLEARAGVEPTYMDLQSAMGLKPTNGFRAVRFHK